MGARGVRGADDRAEVVRVFDAIENDVQASCGDGLFESRESLGCAESHDALMGGSGRGAIEHFAGFETDGNAVFAREVDDFLNPGPRRTARNQDTIYRAPGAQGFTDGMDSCERGHYDKGTLMSVPENTVAQPAVEQIPDKLYFRIGEVARLAGIKPYVLRFWETEFPSLGPKKSGTGHRLYRRKEVEMVLEIKRLLYEKRFTIEGARKFLETRGKVEPAKAPKAVKAAKKVQAELFSTGPGGVSEAALQDIRKELREIAEMLK